MKVVILELSTDIIGVVINNTIYKNYLYDGLYDKELNSMLNSKAILTIYDLKGDDNNARKC